MSKPVLGFIPEPLILSMDKIQPSRKTPEKILTSKKFRQIVASIQAVGLIEPLNISKPDKSNGLHLLLDGHIRLLALRQLRFTDAPCLVATDDESYTYNNRINRMSTIQEHQMIRRAVERGITPEKLAEALDVDISLIHRKANLLDGVCAEAAELLKDHHFSLSLATLLRKLKPIRQVECVDLMLSANSITVAYAQALVAATPSHLLVGGTRPRKMTGVTAEHMAKMEREMGSLQNQYKLAEQSYGKNVLNLVLTKGYLTRLIDNLAVTRHLSKHQPDVLSEFQNIVHTMSLDK